MGRFCSMITAAGKFPTRHEKVPRSLGSVLELLQVGPLPSHGHVYGQIPRDELTDIGFAGEYKNIIFLNNIFQKAKKLIKDAANNDYDYPDP